LKQSKRSSVDNFAKMRYFANKENAILRIFNRKEIAKEENEDGNLAG